MNLLLLINMKSDELHYEDLFIVSIRGCGKFVQARFLNGKKIFDFLFLVQLNASCTWPQNNRITDP